jgi:eukaryotic-like serine/threonine-protein kinase
MTICAPLQPLLHLAFNGVLKAQKSSQDWKPIMELWTEYEGRTIDGDFPLTKLLRPEGRSAFFSTSNGTGVPTVIRLIESHFDDDEILARWRGVTALNHANLVKLKKYGQVDLDGTSLVYAVMEPVEANLGEILGQQRLTLQETRQIATSLVAALETLHENGFVHEHVEPSNVLAVGEVVKLRSDCIREAPEGEEGRDLKRRDVHDLAVVLLQALTQQKTLEGAARDLPLAAPFDEIVRKGMSGEWGLARIGGALDASAPRRESAPRPVAKPVVAAPVAAAPVAAMRQGAPIVSYAAAAAATQEKKVVEIPRVADRIRVSVKEESAVPGGRSGMKIAIAVAALLVIWLGWHLLHGRSGGQSSAPQAASRPAPIVDTAARKPVVENAPTNAAASVPPVQEGVTGGRDQWRVVAFTYNHEGQAQDKAKTIGQSHSDLKPEVFTPNGRAPYLVTLGGPMSRDQAFALSGKAKREGLPRDIYAQNYRAR